LVISGTGNGYALLLVVAFGVLGFAVRIIVALVGSGSLNGLATVSTAFRMRFVSAVSIRKALAGSFSFHHNALLVAAFRVRWRTIIVAVAFVGSFSFHCNAGAITANGMLFGAVRIRKAAVNSAAAYFLAASIYTGGMRWVSAWAAILFSAALVFSLPGYRNAGQVLANCVFVAATRNRFVATAPCFRVTKIERAIVIVFARGLL
jgi:hypothetical protein